MPQHSIIQCIHKSLACHIITLNRKKNTVDSQLIFRHRNETLNMYYYDIIIQTFNVTSNFLNITTTIQTLIIILSKFFAC